MPGKYYFERFNRADFTVCMWFIDTQKFTESQRSWLDNSISDEKSECTWKVVNGHHPGSIHGSLVGSGKIGKVLEPILERHDVDIYICGHHHNNQHFTNLPYKLNVFVVGQVSLDHPVSGDTKKGQFIWGTNDEPAILALTFKSTEVQFSFHGGLTNAESHSGSILA